jgi:N-acetylneuraminate lyase
MGNVKFSGIMSALVSPVNEDGSIKEESMRRLMEWHLKEGFTGFYLCGGTGEGVVMQVKDRMKLVEIAKDAMGGRAKLIAHIGAVDLKSAVTLAKLAGSIGLDAVSSVPPFFYGYGEKEIKQYYSAIAEAAGIPVLMYASPLSGVNITWDMVDRLMDIPGMIGLKWTSYDYFTMHRIKELRGGDINVINGPDECLLCGLSMGADGGIGATYNVMPKLFQKIYTSFRAGDMKAAQEAQFKANKLIAILLKFGVLTGVKDILAMLGYDCGYCTYPMKRFTDEEQAAFRKALKDIRYEEEYI